MTVTIPIETLRAVFKALGTQIETVKIRPQEDGWHLYGKSEDNISIVDAHIRPEGFKEYEVWNDIVVDIDDVLEPIAKGQGDAIIDISKGRLDIKVGRLSFRRKLVADIEVNPRMPALDLDTEFIITASGLDDVLVASSAAGDLRFKAIRFEQTEESMTATIFSDDTDIGQVACTLGKSDFIMLSGEARSRYPASSWVELVKTIPKGAEADVLYKKDYPMMISYTIGSADIRMMVAPQLEDEGDE